MQERDKPFKKCACILLQRVSIYEICHVQSGYMHVYIYMCVKTPERHLQAPTASSGARAPALCARHIVQCAVHGCVEHACFMRVAS